MPQIASFITFGINPVSAITSSPGFNVIISNFDYFLAGAWLTLEITVLSILFGMVLGLIAGLAKLSNNALPRGAATLYIDFFRGTPLFVQILLLYFGVLPYMGVDGPFPAAIIACALNSGAYIGEIVRAGIQAVDKGQTEAARSLGMTQRQAMRYVILPQAYKIVIPPLINEFVALMKDTSLVSIIATPELTHRGDLLYATTYQAAWIWGTVAIIYFIMTKVISVLGDYVERRLATE